MGELDIQIDFAIQSFSGDQNFLTAKINDGRIISIPISWFEHLRKASIEQLQNFEVSPSGYGVHWPEVDEDISIQSFLSPQK